ncbi:uncharacterized protein LOC110847988 [Folsomia candida]|uniref:uncharacterized protein LOC110847988 n=1 Tax=Folsomia candida TaxID=158441 RepID=UPI000B8FED92|nr:uncharacterized protein LOC110847988 [Folsomia candida]
MKNLLIYSFIICVTGGLLVAADTEYKVTSGNKTVHVFWTMNSLEDTHILRCTTEGSPLQLSLKWALGEERKEFFGNATIHVDTKNGAEIKMNFTKIDYEIINEFYCLAYDPANNITISEAVFDIHVLETISGWNVFWMSMFLVAFVVMAVGICRGLKFNQYSTLIET